MDYSSQESLSSALQGAEVAICGLSKEAVALQSNVAYAAKAAGIKLFVPTVRLHFMRFVDNLIIQEFSTYNEVLVCCVRGLILSLAQEKIRVETSTLVRTSSQRLV